MAGKNAFRSKRVKNSGKWRVRSFVEQRHSFDFWPLSDCQKVFKTNATYLLVGS